jgi:hypothetical protein
MADEAQTAHAHETTRLRRTAVPDRASVSTIWSRKRIRGRDMTGSGCARLAERAAH